MRLQISDDRSRRIIGGVTEDLSSAASSIASVRKFVVFFCDRLIIFEVAAGPPLFASFLRVQLALFVAVGVLLASARAAESLFFF